jgi:hypothetical protein
MAIRDAWGGRRLPMQDERQPASTLVRSASEENPMEVIMRRLSFALLCIGLVALATRALAAPPFEFEDGQLKRPTGYREWIYVGAPVTPNELNNGKANFPEFHSVYIDPVSWEHWKQNGEFRDGTILIKEMIDISGKTAPSGNGYFMGEFIGLEAAVKSREHFPDEPGNWAYFTFTTEDYRTLEKTTAANPQAACNSCHGSLGGEDFVFTQYYPVLRSGRLQPVHAVGGTLDRLDRTLPMRDEMMDAMGMNGASGRK